MTNPHVIDRVYQLKSPIPHTAPVINKMGKPRKILMASPEYFDIEYAINPFMKDERGQMNRIDKEKSLRQWQRLKEKYESLGFEVCVIPGHEKLPDMVFMANQSFPYVNQKSGATEVLMSRMCSEFRQPEVTFVKEWFESFNYQTKDLSDQSRYFEGNGDALIDRRFALIYGGYGHRTSKEVYEEVAEKTGYSVIRLNLIRSEYYHLDTCFSILGNDKVAICPEAFDDEGIALIEKLFPVVIRVDHQENLKYFACNCHCPDGKNVLLQKGSTKFSKNLTENGFVVHELETSEYMKSGGSVFCMKMAIM